MENANKKVDKYCFNTKNPVGKGSTASVYLAYNINDNTKAAVKAIPLKKLIADEILQELFVREVEVLTQLKGDHVVRLLDVMQSKNNLYIFMDYCDGGDLESKMKAKQTFTEDEACSIIKQIAEAFVTLKKLEILDVQGKKMAVMHRDIKPANIMFHEGKIKLADFGFAKLINDVDSHVRSAHSALGTPYYMSPQILNFEDYSAKCDVWSAGIVLYELLFRKLPWTGLEDKELYENIMKKPLEFPSPIREDIKDLISKMLKVDESERLSWKGVYNHPALEHIQI